MDKPTTEQLLEHIDFITDIDANELDGGKICGLVACSFCAAIRARLTEYDALKAEVERLNMEIREWQKEHGIEKARAEKAEAERDRLEDMCQDKSARLMDAEAELATRKEIMTEDFLEITRLKSELALAKPLLEVILSHEYGGGTEIVWHGHIIKAALAYRKAKSPEDGEK